MDRVGDEDNPDKKPILDGCLVVGCDDIILEEGGEETVTVTNGSVSDGIVNSVITEEDGEAIHMMPLTVDENGAIIHQSVEDTDNLQLVVQNDDESEVMIEQMEPEEGCADENTIVSEADMAGIRVSTSNVEDMVLRQAGGDQLRMDPSGHITVEITEPMEGALQVIEQGDEMQLDSSQVTQLTDEQVEELSQVQYQNIIVQHMDIAQPLTILRKLLESRLHCSLDDHEFYLQDTIPLDPQKSLVKQCVQGSGMVQINVEVKSQPDIKPRLNIVDILKPAEEVVADWQEPEPVAEPTPPPAQNKVVIPLPEQSENVTRWIVDQSFRKEQERLKIPLDPAQWNEAHVRHWIQWAVKEFKLHGVDIDNFQLTGSQLCNLKHDEFVTYIPNDRGDTFWTHLELLRKCKFVAVIQQPTPNAITTITVSTSGQKAALDQRTPKSLHRGSSSRMRSITISSDRLSHGNRTGNNGQIQLWQFLLELLTDKECREIIHWVGDEGEFKLSNPEMVAQLWGQRKNKPTMNYEKLSRALRYYYDGDMIAKVHGKRFVYKFVCDLQMLLGYSAGELNKLVTECAEKRVRKIRQPASGPAILKQFHHIK